MNKIISVNEYKGTFLEKCYISKSKKSEITPDVILSQLNENFNKSLIGEDIYEKACNQLDNLVEKGGNKKYIRREGSKGNYKYIYKEGQNKGGNEKYEKMTEKELNKKLVDKKIDGALGEGGKVDKTKEVDGFSVKDKVTLNKDVNLISLSNLKGQKLEVIGFVKTGLISKPEFLKVKDEEGEEHEINPEYVSKKIDEDKNLKKSFDENIEILKS